MLNQDYPSNPTWTLVTGWVVSRYVTANSEDTGYGRDEFMDQSSIQSLLIGRSNYWKQSMLLSSQGFLWLLPKWAAYDLKWYIHQKLSEDDTWFLRPLAWRTRRYIIRTFINIILCEARKGWRCLPTTVPVDIVRHVCIESSPWLRWIRHRRMLCLVTT